MPLVPAARRMAWPRCAPNDSVPASSPLRPLSLPLILSLLLETVEQVLIFHAFHDFEYGNLFDSKRNWKPRVFLKFRDEEMIFANLRCDFYEILLNIIRRTREKD